MTLMTIATQIAMDTVTNDPRNQGDPNGDRDFGMTLLMMAVLGIVCLTVMRLFDKWRNKWQNRERRYNRAAIVMLGQAFQPADTDDDDGEDGEDDLTQQMRVW